MKHSFKQEYKQLAEAIVTQAVVLPAIEIKPGMSVPPFYRTEDAAWDTGAEFSIVSPRVIEALRLTPYGKASVMGIGGDRVSDIYMVHIALPNGKIIRNVEVYCSDIDDYDVLLGMDIITQTDFVITNKDNKTIFQFRTPSEGGIELDNTPDAN